MATTKIWPVRDNLARVVEYAENHLKTANPKAYTAKELTDLREVLTYAANSGKTAMQHFVKGINCTDQNAYTQMMATKERFGKTGGNLAYHAYQSFAPEEVTPEQCHQIGIALAKRIWGDRYEVLVTTHLNTKCVHNHFVINSVSCIDGKKLNNNYAMYFNRLRAESDRLCRERGLSVIEKPGRAHKEHWQKNELYVVIRSDIDEAIRRTMTLSQFYMVLRSWGYSINDDPKRKYATIRPPGMQNRIRFKTLGEYYTPEVISRRIMERRPVIVPPVKVNIKRVRFKGRFQDVKTMSGIDMLFFIFVLMLRKIRNINRVENHPHPQRFTPELRTAVRKIDQYSEQTCLLHRHKLKTDADVTTFIDRRKKEISALEHERGKVYNRMKSAKTPEKMAVLKSERDELSARIAVLRKEINTAQGVLTGWEKVRRCVQTQRELGQCEAEKVQQRARERGRDAR